MSQPTKKNRKKAKTPAQQRRDIVATWPEEDQPVIEAIRSLRAGGRHRLADALQVLRFRVECLEEQVETINER